MGVFDLFSKRKRASKKNGPDVYVYNDIPITLRRQIILIWVDAIGPYLEVEPYLYETPLNQIKFG